MEEFKLNGMISPTQLQSKRIKSPAAYIPTEIMEEILSRLPVKFLFKFRCVSKSWLSLISSKTFIKRHLQSSTRKNLLAISMSPKLNYFSLGSLLRAQFTDAIDIDLPMEIQSLQNYSIRDVGHCNGLVCVRVFDTKTHYTSPLFLWNPTTRQSKKIHESGLHCKMDLAIGYGFGFGFDESNDDYKVVVILKKQRTSRTSRASAMLYSLNADLWTKVSCCNSHLLPTHSSGTFVNGKFHWLSRFRFEIVSFDIETKKFGQIDCPHYLHHHDYSFKLFESMGYLSIIAYKLTLTQTSHDLWILKDNGLRQSWTKRYIIPNYVLLERPVCMRKNGKILWLFGSAFGIYNRNNRSSRYPLTKNINLIDDVIIYVERLVSPCGC